MAEQNNGGEMLLQSIGHMRDAQQAVAEATERLRIGTAEIKTAIATLEV